MQKNLASTIISIGLIISATIILSMNRYEVKNAKINIHYGKDGSMTTVDEFIKIDTVTGKVWVHRQGFSSKGSAYDNWELLGAGKNLSNIIVKEIREQ